MAATTRKIKINYTRPKLVQYQTDFIDCEERFCCVEACTKAGKTTGMIVWLFEQALTCKSNQSVFWVAPVYLQAKIAFDRMRSFINDRSFFEANESRLIIKLITGGIIEFKSADNPDTLYGNDCYAAVIDEASRVKEDSWTAIRTTLTATRGKCKLIGNVKGRNNFFYHMSAKARSGEPDFYYRKITCYDAVDAGILSIDEVNQAKRDLPINEFKELYLAEPSETAGNPFGYSYISGCVAPMSNEQPVCFGIDLAKSHDFTCIIGLDKNSNVCYLSHFQKPWEETMEEINRLPDIPMALDSTGAGDVITEVIQKQKNQAEGYVFTAKSKQELMKGLAYAIQNKLLTYPDNIIRKELDLFEYEYSKTGVKYSAPPGKHDDAVCALALAWYKWQTASVSSDGPSVW